MGDSAESEKKKNKTLVKTNIRNVVVTPSMPVQKDAGHDKL